MEEIIAVPKAHVTLVGNDRVKEIVKRLEGKAKEAARLQTAFTRLERRMTQINDEVARLEQELKAEMKDEFVKECRARGITGHREIEVLVEDLELVPEAHDTGYRVILPTGRPATCYLSL